MSLLLERVGMVSSSLVVIWCACLGMLLFLEILMSSSSLVLVAVPAEHVAIVGKGVTEQFVFGSRLLVLLRHVAILDGV
jgi:hypothetical protein